MTLSESIQGTFRPLEGGIYKPFARVAIVADGQRAEDVSENDEIDALLDTGAFINLIPIDLAGMLLNKSEAQLKKGEEIQLVGLSKKEKKADKDDRTGWGWPVNLRVRGSTKGVEFLLWEKAMLYATKMSVPYNSVLIGQKHGLQGRAFIHLNYRAKEQDRMWLIRPGFTRNG